MAMRSIITRTAGTTAMVVLSGLACPAQVDFTTEIQPIFQRKCLECHGPNKVKSGLRLDSRAAALKGGKSDVGIIPGNSGDSPLVHVVEDGDMPPDGPPLTAGEIAKIKAWIDQGARWGKAAPKPRPAAADATPAAGKPKPRPTKPEIPGGILPPLPVPEPSTSSTVLPELPPSADRVIDFGRDIRPLLKQHCIRCHGPEKPKSGFRLDNRASALKGGYEGVSIIPGNSAGSTLIRYVARQVDGMEMPPVGDGRPLTRSEVSLLRTWIDQGVPWDDAAASAPDFAMSLTPAVGWIEVSGNEQKFREHAWMREGVIGGISRFTMEQQLDLDTRFTAEGRAISPADLEFTFDLERQGVGFVRGGVEHFRRYYNNYGGHHAPFAAGGAPIFQLDRTLHLDIGRVWTEVGITRPDWPEITLGYQYRFRDGTKPTLHWGPVTRGFETRNIYPASKDINEDIHIFTADIRHDWRGIRFENNFLAEFTDLETRRLEASPDNFGPAPDIFTTIDETHDATQLTNTFSLQKEFTDWLLLTGGYYYSRRDGDATFRQSTINGAGAVVFGQQWPSQPVVLDWHAHMLNVSTRLGSWKGLTLSAGAQSNWERQSAIGDATLFFGLPDPMVPIPGVFSSTVSSDKQSFSIKEHVALRYDRIPHTVLFAEAELEHEATDYFEQDNGSFQGFTRDTESSGRDQDYRIGFTLSPSRFWSFNSHVRHRRQEDRYDHLVDTIPGGFPNDGYSAFILGRDLDTREIKTRLKLRPVHWLEAHLSYRMQSTEYATDTDPVAFGAPSDTPGGSIPAGEYDADVYGLNLVLSPWEKFSLNSALTYHDSHTRTASNGDPAVEDFEGGTITAYIGGRYVIDQDTEFSAGYGFARGDFSQGHSADGLPLGIEFDQHSLQAALSARLSETIQTQIQYRFQQYDEPTAGGFNDYTAHGVFANLTFAW